MNILKKQLLNFFLVYIFFLNHIGYATQNSNLLKLWGISSKPSISLGMWSYHLGNSKDTNDNNALIGLSYKSGFFGTIKNSFHDRSYVGGLQRIVWNNQINNNLEQIIGWRLGAIFGYKTKKGIYQSGRKVFGIPLVPLPQIFYDIKYKNVGLEFSTAFKIISAGFKIYIE